MSDDQGDAERIESVHGTLSTLGTRIDALAEGVTELRELLERSTSRNGAAGLREDLAQLRALVSSVIERDLTEDVRAVRSTLEELSSRDVTDPVRDDLAGLRDLVVSLQESDTVGAIRADLEPLRTGLHRVEERLADDTAHTRLLERLTGLESRLDAIAGADRTDEIVGRLDSLATRDQVGGLEDHLDTVASRDQVGGLAADLRAHLTDALGGLDGHAVAAELRQVHETVDDERHRVADTLERLQEALLDVASGEVVGALWDEVRTLRSSVDQLAVSDEGEATGALVTELRGELERLVEGLRPADDGGRAELLDGVNRTSADLRALSHDLSGALGEIRDLTAAVERLTEESTAEGAAAEGPDPALVALREQMERLTEEVSTLLDAAEVGADEATEPAEPAGPPPGLEGLVDGLASLRAELREGLVVEPSDDLTTTLEALRTEVDGLRSGLAPLPDLEPALDALRSAVDDLRELTTAGAEPAGGAEGDGDASPDLLAELARIRADIGAVQERLDEGLVIADDGDTDSRGPDGDTQAVGDQIAGLRDHLTAELDGLRLAITQAAPTREPDTGAPETPGESVATIDPDTIDLLREEIRAAGGVSDEVVDALRDELKALRRRLAVKAQEKVLSDDQLREIADVVAERLQRE